MYLGCLRSFSVSQGAYVASLQDLCCCGWEPGRHGNLKPSHPLTILFALNKHNIAHKISGSLSFCVSVCVKVCQYVVYLCIYTHTHACVYEHLACFALPAVWNQRVLIKSERPGRFHYLFGAKVFYHAIGWKWKCYVMKEKKGEKKITPFYTAAVTQV